MEAVMNMTEARLLEALREAFQRPETDQEALLMHEIAALWGLSHPSTGRVIRQLVLKGVVQCVRKEVADITGRVRPLPAYRIAA